MQIRRNAGGVFSAEKRSGLPIAKRTALSGERINVVVGDGDPSAKWAKVLADKSGAQIDILPETDYLFSGKSDEFAALPEKYLF